MNLNICFTLNEKWTASTLNNFLIYNPQGEWDRSFNPIIKRKNIYRLLKAVFHYRQLNILLISGNISAKIKQIISIQINLTE